MVRKPPANARGTRDVDSELRTPGSEDPLKEGMTTHSSILAWRIPQIEEPGLLQFMRSQSDMTSKASKK